MYQSDLNHTDQNLQSKLQHLYTLNTGAKIDLSFRPPYLELLEKLGNPHLNLPPTIHVAGTNGKGSTIAMLRSIYEEAGYKIHAYTSPHLIHFNERIVLTGQEIRNDYLENLIDEVLELNDGNDLTFFEITTAIAFAAFTRTPADLCLLEVGMGGRLDCTNIIENPIATIITNIGMDHTEFLGDTIEKIATEKAGIMKANAPCIIGAQNFDAAYDVVINKAQDIDTKLYNADEKTAYETNLIGPHQKQNMANALKAVEILQDNFPVSSSHIQNGLQNVKWRARLQKLNPHDFDLSDTIELYLDGGHNVAAGQMLAKQAQNWRKQNDKNLYLVIGMMKGKETNAFVSPLLTLAKNIYCVNIENEPQSQTAQELQAQITDAKTASNFLSAIQDIQTFDPNARILICGSFYLAGQVLQHTIK